MSKIYFISEMKSPISNRASSTTIMVNNMLIGLKRNGHSVFLVAIGNHVDEKEIYEFYEPLIDGVVFYESAFEKDGINRKYQALFKELKSWIFPWYYRKIGNKINMSNCDIIITHSPSSESIILANVLLNRVRTRYIQFWSDPMTLSGICPEDIGIKRRIIYHLEKKCLSKSKEIVFGTESLMDFQKKLFPHLSDYMRYVDISYNWDLEPGKKYTSERDRIQFGYFGNYYSTIRDIRPLYQAFADCIEKADLIICGSSDIQLDITSNINILSRVSPQEAEQMENSMDVIVCVLNKNCVQIPGKIFYKTCTNKPILVVLDGKYQETLKKYLEKYDRFVFCNNNYDELKKVIHRICEKDIQMNNCSCGISAEEMAEQLLMQI